MRLWSLHPRYLDTRGLVALWREALLAQAVLAGRTRGYTQHPQLQRFAESPAPAEYIGAYLRAVHRESVRRGFQFDGSKIDCDESFAPLTVTRGQLDYEWTHLRQKLAIRSPDTLDHLANVKLARPHPLFRVVRGDIAHWERLGKA
ncbi:MAG: pyrimidine dimer DNA glycosylase/endonuclease V [Gemmatimonadaceae bacterium]